MSYPEVQVRNRIGVNVLRYLRLRDNHGITYFGGDTDHGPDETPNYDRGPHYFHHPGSMLELLAKLTHDPRGPFSLHGTHCADVVVLEHGRPVMADKVAAILDILPAEVVTHFGLLVRLEPQNTAERVL